MDLNEIANSGGYGSGGRAIEMQRARDIRNSLIPDPSLMGELVAVTSKTSYGAPVASFGHCPDTDKDWSLEHNSMLGLVDGRSGTASADAQVIAALWNAFRDGDLVWRRIDEEG